MKTKIILFAKTRTGAVMILLLGWTMILLVFIDLLDILEMVKC